MTSTKWVTLRAYLQCERPYPARNRRWWMLGRADRIMGSGCRAASGLEVSSPRRMLRFYYETKSARQCRDQIHVTKVTGLRGRARRARRPPLRGRGAARPRCRNGSDPRRRDVVQRGRRQHPRGWLHTSLGGRALRPRPRDGGRRSLDPGGVGHRIVGHRIKESTWTSLRRSSLHSFRANSSTNPRRPGRGRTVWPSRRWSPGSSG